MILKLKLRDLNWQHGQQWNKLKVQDWQDSFRPNPLPSNTFHHPNMLLTRISLMRLSHHTIQGLEERALDLDQEEAAAVADIDIPVCKLQNYNSIY